MKLNDIYLKYCKLLLIWIVKYNLLKKLNLNWNYYSRLHYYLRLHHYFLLLFYSNFFPLIQPQFASLTPSSSWSVVASAAESSLLAAGKALLTAAEAICGNLPGLTPPAHTEPTPLSFASTSFSVVTISPKETIPSIQSFVFPQCCR